MKKILFLIDTIDVGGATKLTFDFISKINKKEYDVKIFYLNEQKFPGVNSVDLFNSELKCELIWFKNFRILRRIIYFYKNFRNFDLVHSCMEQSNFYSSLVKNIPFANFKLVITYHGLDSVYSKDFKQINTNLLKRYYYLLIMKYIQNILFKKTDSFIAVCQAIRKYLIEERNIKPEKAEVIYHGLNLGYFTSLIEESEKNDIIFKKENVFIAGYIGRLSYGKGLEELIEIIPDIVKKDNSFRFVFKGEGELKSYISERIKELKIQEYISIESFEKNVYNFYKSINLLVLPSYYETTNLTLLESMYSGTPVFASDTGGIPEIIENCVNGFLFETGNFRMFAEKLLEIRNYDPLKMKIITEKGYNTVIQKFNMDVNSNLILNKLESVAAVKK